jgi:hypothetical protein
MHALSTSESPDSPFAAAYGSAGTLPVLTAVTAMRGDMNSPRRTWTFWCDDEPDGGNSLLNIETVEAEVVFLIRAAGQWPLWQTEIHFHPSSQVHRDTARFNSGEAQSSVSRCHQGRTGSRTMRQKTPSVFFF